MVNDYTKEPIPDISVDMPEQVNWLHKQGNLHPACYSCVRRKRAETDGPTNPETRKPEYKKGEFLVRCTGIPLDYLRILPPEVVENMSESEVEDFLETQDPIYWAYKNLDWYPRKSREGIEYQKVLISCTATRKMSRIGRRSGKTAALAVKALRHAFLHASSTKTGVDAASGGTNNGDVLIVTPYGYQTGLIFNEMRNLILKATPKVTNSVKRDVKNPHELYLSNGSHIIGRTASERSGGKAEAIRGQGGSLIVFDEMDYLSNDSVETVLAILTENENAILWGSSTPKGRRDSKYYQFCNSPLHCEFHWPSQVSPAWTDETEREQRLLYDRISYEREILAEWGEQRGGVFPVSFVNKACKDIEYEYGIKDNPRHSDWAYTIGVDWNQNTGTQVVVVGQSPQGLAYIVDRAEVDPKQYKQMEACLKVRDLNRIWHCDAIYVDDGFGAAQTEWLHAFGEKAIENLAKFRKLGKRAVQGSADDVKFLVQDSRLKEIVKAINFSSKEVLVDPATNQEIKVPTKPALVQNCMRRFEQSSIRFPETDQILKDQLMAYIELRVSSMGIPVYGSSEPKVGDHIVDALFLACWALTKEFSVFGVKQYDLQVAYVKNFGSNDTGSGQGGRSLVPRQTIEPLKRDIDIFTDRDKMYIPEPDEDLKRNLLGDLYEGDRVREENKKKSLPVSGARKMKGKHEEKPPMLSGPRVAVNKRYNRNSFSREIN